MFKKLTAIALIAGFVGMTSIASAQDGVDIGGDAIALGVVSGAQIAAAIGDGSTAKAQAGVIAGGVKIGGDAIALGVVSGAQIAASIGEDSVACAQAGVIGDACKKE